MHINGSLPTHIARAYGVSLAKPTPPTNAPQQAKTSTGTHGSNPVRSLLAGRVDGPVNFDAPSTARPADAPALPLYTRAADKVEAAVAVQVGRTVDVKG